MDMSAGTIASLSSPVLDYLSHLHNEYSSLNEGKVATYIPELGKANPDWFGICLATTNGAVYEVGDSQQPFTIQSISKPFVYGLALEDNGRSPVLQRVGVEPTGDAFNSISLDPGTGRPRNPMINAGAIASAGLVVGKNGQIKFRRVMDMLGAHAGRELSLDDAVFRSENETGHRNRAIGHMLRNFDVLEQDPTPTVELYFKQCSVSVTCRDLGIMAATLANRGINPITHKQALRGEYVESVLSVMGSCGMYDYAGEWIYTVGMPAKSGVSGGVIAVLPGQLGIGVFSPLLDPLGNSIRGIKVCKDLARHLDLHVFNRPNVGEPVIRVQFTAAHMTSSRIRTAAEARALQQFGSRIRVYQLQGHLAFATTEALVRESIERAPTIDFLLLDLKRVLSLNESSCRLIYQLLRKLAAAGKFVVFAHTTHLPLLRRYMKVKLESSFNDLYRVFEDHDPALEWCENELLASVLPEQDLDKPACPAEYELFAGLTDAELAVVSGLLKRRSYPQGERIVTTGQPARELFFLASGHVSVTVELVSGALKRLAAFSAGMAFGEMSILDRAPRSANIVADTNVECDLLALEDFDQLGQTHPAIKIKLLENLSLGLCRKLRKVNRDISVFD
jgi:glutaminase